MSSTQLRLSEFSEPEPEPEPEIEETIDRIQERALEALEQEGAA